MTTGTVSEIWRYPVKSMVGERIQQARVGALGIAGDRGWAVRDEVRGGIRGAKKIAGLMRCAARYLDDPTADRIPTPEITLPNGDVLRADASDAAARLSAALGTTVTLWPRRPADDLDHYRRGAPDHEDMETEMRSVFGRTPDEPLPDFTVFPPELFEFESPLGTYFDAFPLLIVTTASLRHLQARAPSSRIDVRRFRPNFVVDTGDDDEFLERTWGGRRLRVGDVVLALTVPCPRCVMITLPTADLPKDPAILRTVVRDGDQNLGIYATVETPGLVRAGDPVTLV
jgi:MOSC domain-containing protein